MFQPHLPQSDYELIDFGAGRKLERLGGLLINRPSPGATSAPLGSELWNKCDASFALVLDGQWHYRNSWRESLRKNAWICKCEGIRMQIKPTPAGHVGIFPEHWAHWNWLYERLSKTGTQATAPRVLSLFAYTGATTLALAHRGCEVTHVDASKPTVQWARENCELSGLVQAPIRWIVDDATAFVKRELRRNKQYEAIILDPPTYGHGASGDRWEIHRDLMPLLENCWRLLSDDRRAVLLCGHSTHISVRDINKSLSQIHGQASVGQCEITQAYLVDQNSRKLDCGFAARYEF